MPMQLRNSYESVTVLASAARTATAGTNGSSVRLPTPNNGFLFTLDQTNAANDVDDTLNVYVQTLIDGTNWIDVVAFTQQLGNGTDSVKVTAKIGTQINQAMINTDATLAAGSVRHLFGDEWRARWVIVDPSGSNATFTFGVVALPF